MKIIKVRTVLVGNPWKNWLFVLLDTDEGITGLGEGSLGLSTLPVQGAVQELERFIVGKDPLDIPSLWDQMARGWYLPSDPVHITAMTSVEIACWDLLGKVLGAPLYQILGGRARERVPVYANGWYTGPRTPEAYAARALNIVKQGFKALKFDPFGDARITISPFEEDFSMDIIAAVRDTVGQDIDLMIEGHDRFDVPTAIRVAKRMERYRITWYEAPVPSYDIDALSCVASNSPVPIAAGERFSNLSEFARLASQRKIYLWQPETLSIGGVTAIQQVAALGIAFGASLSPHNARGPVATTVNAHLSTWMPNLYIQEYFVENAVPIAFEVLPGTPRVIDGFIQAPQGPGLGVELDVKAAQAYPYRGENFMELFKSGWENRFIKDE